MRNILSTSASFHKKYEWQSSTAGNLQKYPHFTVAQLQVSHCHLLVSQQNSAQTILPLLAGHLPLFRSFDRGEYFFFWIILPRPSAGLTKFCPIYLSSIYTLPPLLNVKLIRFGPRWNENPVLSLFFRRFFFTGIAISKQYLAAMDWVTDEILPDEVSF